MDLKDAEKYLARARQREEEMQKENVFSDSLLQNDKTVEELKIGGVAAEEICTEEPRKTNASVYPVEQLRRLSRESENSSTTRASALFTPNANYYAPLSVIKSSKQPSGQLEPLKAVEKHVASETAKERDPATKSGVTSAKLENNVSSPLKFIDEVAPNEAEEHATILTHGETTDDEKPVNGPLESTTIVNSPSVSSEAGDSKIKRFFENQSTEHTSPCPPQPLNNSEPSPIPKILQTPVVTTDEDPVLFSGRNRRSDVVDEIAVAAKNATKALENIPSGSGRAREIALRLEEKTKQEGSSTPLSYPPSKTVKPSSLNKSTQPTTDVHIHYRLTASVPKHIPRVVAKIDTTSANVKSLRSRWEVSSSSGAPLHPDQNEDDLLEAARQMSRAVKQSNQWRTRPHSYYESEEPVGAHCNKNFPIEGASSGGEMELAIAAKEPDEAAKQKEEEKTKKRSSKSDDNEGSDDASSLEKKPKREEKDESKLSGQLVGEALGAFEFLDETPTRNSSFLSSILDSTPDLRTPKQPDVQKDSEEKKDDNDEIPLVHSVSFYRKKKKEMKSVGETTILGQFATSPPHSSENYSQKSSPLKHMSAGQRFAAEKQRLEKDMLVQDEQIAQAAKALRLCRKNLEFRGSRMEVDAQRALLIAKERRRALQNAYDDLIQGYARGKRTTDQPKPKGTLTVKDISLRLMRDFINGHINYHSDQTLYYFIVLIRHEETVHHTTMVTSDDGLQSGYVSFPNYIQLKSLSHDFTCVMEVYALRTKRELFSQPTTLKKPPRLPSFHQGSSPGGVAEVIDPSFQKIGTLALNIGNISKTKFRLLDVMSPLDGSVTMTLTCFPEETGTIGHKGFLSLYQEVQNIASWTRFWCVLNDGNLRFWKYPEDEASKKPVVIINLRDSASEEIRPLGPETCPYPHSMTIDIWVESVQRRGKHEKIRIMMAADTKEDMHRWLGVLNESLRNITLWYPKC
ncbi:unnamed protein product [Enterobius vermicularis]|uniref:PH domain-containing protein n=1 Tax=Enterobius vermicularis TaxID=51028 RepID=A0A0N4V051_ENTVE|nr:unnamed protein product [Enterobius vermicularis]